MQYHKQNDFYPITHNALIKRQQGIVDLAEQLMNTDTKENLINNIFELYQIIGQILDTGEEVAKQQDDVNYAQKNDGQGYLFDKLIELSYIVHRDQWRKPKVGGFKRVWLAPAAYKDDVAFEQYLNSLKL